MLSDRGSLVPTVKYCIGFTAVKKKYTATVYPVCRDVLQEFQILIDTERYEVCKRRASSHVN